MKTKQCVLKKGGVLLLGGDTGLQGGLRCALEKENFDVLTAATREEVEGLLDARLINIVVVDLDNQPQSVCAWLEQLSAERRKLRVLGICHPNNGGRKAGLGFVRAWTDKPVQPRKLATTVNSLLAGLRAQAFREDLLRRETHPLIIALPRGRWWRR